MLGLGLAEGCRPGLRQRLQRLCRETFDAGGLSRNGWCDCRVLAQRRTAQTLEPGTRTVTGCISPCWSEGVATHCRDLSKSAAPPVFLGDRAACCRNRQHSRRRAPHRLGIQRRTSADPDPRLSIDAAENRRHPHGDIAELSSVAARIAPDGDWIGCDRSRCCHLRDLFAGHCLERRR